MIRIILKKYTSVPILYRMLAAFVIGGIAGVFFWYLSAHTTGDIIGYLDSYVAPFGLVLVKMLKMIVIPLVFFSLLQGASSLPIRKFGRIGVKIILLYLITSLIAATLGTVLAVVTNPGKTGIDLNEFKMNSNVIENKVDIPGNKTLSGILLNLFENPFNALSTGNFLPIIVFSILAGLALRIVMDQNPGDKGAELLISLINTCNRCMFILVDWIMEYAPVGILSLTMVNFSKYGPKLAGPYFNISVGVITGIMLMIFLVYSSLYLILCKSSPVSFYKACYHAMITAFVTRSSGATLPVTLKTAIDKLRIRKELAEFSLPLGATINMDGVCIHLPMFAIFAANLFGIQLQFGALLLLVITTVLAAIGAGGIPGGSLMLLFLILNTMGLSEAQISLIVAFALGINPILDMFETMNNVTGDLMCTYIVAEKEDMLEKAPIE